jgi:NAD(P)-dependent dehydrogenase (short-subunit alcohol dehydrogenase family)
VSSEDEAPFRGRVAVVTGAGAGLGRSHARLLASLGAAVVVNDIGGSVSGSGSSSSPAHDVVREISEAGGAAVADTSSVATVAGGRTVIETAVQEFGHVDIVVNNAGILRDKFFDDLDEATWDAVMDVHLRGSYNVTRPAWKHMRERGGGHIVFTTSAAGLFGNPGHANYGSAKAGVFGLMRMLAVEGAPHGIRSNAIAPLALTRMSSSKDGDRARASDLMGSLFQRLSPDQVSPLVAWLCHDSCPATGEAFSVGGGRIARIFLAEAPGWVGRDASWADVRDNWDAICDPTGYSVPTSMHDELVLYTDALEHL